MDVRQAAENARHREEESRPRSQMAALPPYDRRRVRVRDVPSLLLRERIIFLPYRIDENVTRSVVGMLLHLEREDPERDIQLYIDCEGEFEGHFYHGLGIYDVMQHIRPDIVTVCVGMAQGVAAAFLAGGTKGKRYCLPHASIVLNQPYSGAQGQASDIDIRAREVIRQRGVFHEILARHTGQPVERIKQDADRRHYLTAEQALAYGIVDEIIMPPAIKRAAKE
jgi:ATP-dependent Clp protease protease subunit